MALLEVKNLSKHFVVERSFWGKPTKILKAVNNVSLNIDEGENTWTCRRIWLWQIDNRQNDYGTV